MDVLLFGAVVVFFFLFLGMADARLSLLRSFFIGVLFLVLLYHLVTSVNLFFSIIFLSIGSLREFLSRLIIILLFFSFFNSLLAFFFIILILLEFLLILKLVSFFELVFILGHLFHVVFFDILLSFILSFFVLPFFVLAFLVLTFLTIFLLAIFVFFSIFIDLLIAGILIIFVFFVFFLIKLLLAVDILVTFFLAFRQFLEVSFNFSFFLLGLHMTTLFFLFLLIFLIFVCELSLSQLLDAVKLLAIVFLLFLKKTLLHCQSFFLHLKTLLVLSNLFHEEFFGILDFELIAFSLAISGLLFLLQI